jgi:DNA-binding transcriptional ArsR family regulator
MNADTRTAITSLAYALSDDTRLRIIATLSEAENRSLAVTDLAEHLALAQPRISTHLAILLQTGLVEMRASGRARLYRIVPDRTLPAVNGLLAATGQEPLKPLSPAAARAVRLNSPYRNARTCYDHLAGRAAVDLLDSMVFDRWLIRIGGQDERPQFEVTEDGRRSLAMIGINVDQLDVGRRQVACGCLDWTERKPHLAGALGSAVLDSLLTYGYVRRNAKPRHVSVVRDLDDWLSERKPLLD